MKFMSKYGKVITVSAAALAMTAALTIESSMAYFTTYAEAEGSVTVNLGAKTELEETVSNMTKHVVVKNTSTNSCFVRVKAFSGSQVICTPSGSNWSRGEDDYWYYGPVLEPESEQNKNSSTEPLDISFDITGLGDNPENFNVVVIQECTPVIYDEEGNPSADWNTVYTDFDNGEEAGN